jgi:heme/copper-type cytochrome/quinol oxidase subunit 3
LTVLLGAIFLAGTAQEWYQLIYHDGLTIQTNLFGTTFYSLVGLHASHVIVGLLMLSLTLIFSLRGQLTESTRAARSAVAVLAFCGCCMGHRLHCGVCNWQIVEQSRFRNAQRQFRFR